MSWATQTLTQVETAITSLASSGIKSYSINGRSFTRENLRELINLRKELLTEIARENADSEFILAELGGSASYRRFEL